MVDIGPFKMVKSITFYELLVFDDTIVPHEGIAGNNEFLEIMHSIQLYHHKELQLRNSQSKVRMHLSSTITESEISSLEENLMRYSFTNISFLIFHLR